MYPTESLHRVDSLWEAGCSILRDYSVDRKASYPRHSSIFDAERLEEDTVFPAVRSLLLCGASRKGCVCISFPGWHWFVWHMAGILQAASLPCCDFGHCDFGHCDLCFREPCFPKDVPLEDDLVRL